MKFLKKQYFLPALFIAIFVGWFAFKDTVDPQISNFDYNRDHVAIRQMFEHDWDWLIPVSRDRYSIDFLLQQRAPHQNPLYAGRLIFKVLRKQNETIGFTAYYMKNSENAFFNFLDIKPEYRGKGYAEKLARYAINDMVDRGATTIRIVTYPHNTPALNLYRKLGFVEIGRNSQVELEYTI